MATKLTQRQIAARLMMYEELIDYCDLYDSGNAIERIQMRVLQSSLRKQRDRFVSNHGTGDLGYLC